MSELDRVLAAAAAAGLPGTEGREPVAVPAEVLDDLLRVARMDRLAGVLSAAILDGVLIAPESAASAIRDTWHEQLRATVLVEALAVEIAEILQDAGVTWRLLKGPALAHLDYPDPSIRPFGDVDLLIHPDSWGPALRLLAEAGWRRDVAELGPGFDERYGKGATLTNRDGLELDLHRRLAVGRFGVRLPSEALFAGTATVAVGGRSLPALAAPDRLLHACFHAALGGFREFRAHRDVAQLLLVTAADWEATIRTATRWRVESVVARAIVDAFGILGPGLAHPAFDWARASRIRRADAYVLDLFAAERPYRSQALTAVPDLLGRGAARYLWLLIRQPGPGGAPPP